MGKKINSEIGKRVHFELVSAFVWYQCNVCTYLPARLYMWTEYMWSRAPLLHHKRWFSELSGSALHVSVPTNVIVCVACRTGCSVCLQFISGFFPLKSERISQANAYKVVEKSPKYGKQVTCWTWWIHLHPICPFRWESHGGWRIYVRPLPLPATAVRGPQ